MLNVLSRIGRRACSFLGEPALGSDVFEGKYFQSREALFDIPTLTQTLPYRSYDPEQGVFLGDGFAGFSVEALPIVGCEESVVTALAGLYEEVLQEGASIQCLLLADHRIQPWLHNWQQARDCAHPTLSLLAGHRTSFFQGQSQTVARNFRFILSYSLATQKVTSEQKKALADTRSRILKILGSLSYAFAWGPNQFLTTVGSLVNFDFSTDLHQRVWNPYELLSHQLPMGPALAIERGCIQWEGEGSPQFRSYRAADLPQEWSLAGMHSLLGDVLRDAYRIQTPFALQYGVHMPMQSKAEGSFKRRSALIENQGKSGTLIRMIPALAEELSECDYVRRSLRQGDRFVWTGLTAGIWSSSDQTHQHEQALESLFRIQQFRLQRNDHTHLPSFLSMLPMTWGSYASSLRKLAMLKTTLSSECVSFVPIQAEWRGTPTPGMLLQGRRGQVLNWNPFDNQSGNYNTVVVGRSGSGKSVFMQDLLVSGLGTGAKVYILEVGRSFEKMAHLLDGQHIEFSRDTPICLNPFSNIPTQDEEERITAFSMIKSVVACMASPIEGTSDYDNSLIEKGVAYAWETRGTEATITDIAKYLSEQTDPQAKILGTMLTPYAKGGLHARYFEGTNNVGFRSPMVLIELEELKEKKDLQAVVLQLFIMAITNQAFLGDRKTPFYICIDEAWDLLRGKQTGVFIETLARRLRKYNGSLIIGTQSVDDFFAAPGALAAFENSDWMCLLAQKKSSIARLSTSGKIQMTDGMQYALESVTTRHGAYSEVMILDADGNYSIARLVLDRFSQLLYSTKADEYARIKELRAHGRSVAEAIEALIQEEH